MKKILEISSCDDCPHQEEYENAKAKCSYTGKWIRTADFPKWCPLKSVKEKA